MPRSSLLALLPIHTPEPGLPQPPSVLVVLSIIIGLPVALWTYKSLMMIIFQRKIIYMGYLPIGARKERLEDMPPQYLAGIDCEEIHPPSIDPKAHLSGLLVRPKAQTEPPKAVIVYFQGNAGGPLHRLPVFQRLMSSLYPSPSSPSRIPSAIIAIAPRSYWKSTPLRPSQRGLTADYLSALKYALTRFPDACVILYGHSLGGAIAVCLLAELRASASSGSRVSDSDSSSSSSAVGILTSPDSGGGGGGDGGGGLDTKRIQGLVLENPFASVPGMLAALYPQRWVPYRHLTAFVWDRWDALSALRAAAAAAGPGPPKGRDGREIFGHGAGMGDQLQQQQQQGEREEGAEGKLVLARLAGRMLVLVSELDEMVPTEMGREMVRAVVLRREGVDEKDDAVAGKGGGGGKEEAGGGRGLTKKLVVVKGALHEDAWDRRGWAEAMRDYVRGVVGEEERVRTK